MKDYLNKKNKKTNSKSSNPDELMINMDEIQSSEHILVLHYSNIFVLLNTNVNQFYDKDVHFPNQEFYLQHILNVYLNKQPDIMKDQMYNNNKYIHKVTCKEITLSLGTR
jgi:hypothetical protein